MDYRTRALTPIWLVTMSFMLTNCTDDVSLEALTDTSGVNLEASQDVSKVDAVSESDFDVPALLPELEETEVEAPEDESAVTFMPLSEGGDVVSFVEVERYMGRWYEIATTPSFQQAACTNTQAEYTFNAAMGWVDVVNTCTVSGNNQQIQGRAELVDLDTQAKLKVIFFGQAAPYWVVALDGSDGEEPYQWSIVSVPGKQVIWILSRTKTMPAEQREAIEAHLLERGFPVDTLIDTPHLN